MEDVEVEERVSDDDKEGAAGLGCVQGPTGRRVSSVREVVAERLSEERSKVPGAKPAPRAPTRRKN